jgi:hypothetical protein
MTDQPDYASMTSDQLGGEIAHLEAKIEAIDAASKPSAPMPETAFDKKNDKALTAELGKTFDKAEAREDAAIANKDVPSVKVDSFDSAFEKTYDFLNSSKAEKASLRDANALVDQVRQNAKKFGVELTDAEAFRAAMDLENQQAAQASAAHAPVLDHMKAAFRDSDPVESAKWFSQVANDFRQNPVATLSWLGQQAGLSPMQLAQAIAQQHGHQPMQQHQSQQQALAAAEAEMGRVIPTLENFSKYEDDIVDVLSKNGIRRTGNITADLKAAYKEASRRDAKLSADEKLDKSLRRTYDKANRRG